MFDRLENSADWFICICRTTLTILIAEKLMSAEGKEEGLEKFPSVNVGADDVGETEVYCT